MIKNPLRCGNFTSSQIANLMTYAKNGYDFGKPALTYIEEKNMERRLGRSISEETNAKPLSWGEIVEKQVFAKIGTEYRLCSDETIRHPEIEYWAGSPDAQKFDEGKTVIDIKCPLTLKSFCHLVDPLKYADNEMECIMQIRQNHQYGEKYFWQLVSNAILTNSRYAELIVYMPYLSELEAIRELRRNYDGNQNRFAWINFSTDDELPYLIEGGYYKNLNVIRFEIQNSDKEFLTERVKAAGALLQQSELNKILGA